MTRYNQTERAAHNQRHPVKPILYWEAYNGNLCIDSNNSVAILRSRYTSNKSITFRAVR